MKKRGVLQPVHICLFILCCMLVLAMVCIALPREVQLADNVIRFPQLDQVLDITDSIPDANMTLEDTLDTVLIEQDTLPTSPDTIVQPQTDVLTPEMMDTLDTRIFLHSFYQALQQMDSSSIRIIHYGDSQIEEDRLSMQIRRKLQAAYGGGGVGLLPLHQTIPTSTIWQRITMNGSIQSINQGPKRYLAYGPQSYRRSNSVYGVMGQVAVMNNQLKEGSEDITLHVKAFGTKHYSDTYFNRIRVVSTGDIQVSVDKALGKDGHLFLMPDSSTEAHIHFQGNGDVFGISLENQYGVMLDNIPMRGCSGVVFTNIASDEIREYVQNTNVKLIILQYGGNNMPFTTSKEQVKQYIRSMRTQIEYLQYIAPESSILFVGPGDMSEHRDGQMQTYRMLPQMDKALRQLAIEKGIAYYSLYEMMGGYNSMLKWKELNWAGSDYVHFTKKGAEIAGEMLANWLLKK